MSPQAERPDEEVENGSVEAVSSGAETGAEQAVESDVPPSVEDLQVKVEENWDRYLRTAAELQNVRKRAARDVDSARKFALERFGREMLAVKDSLELGMASADSASVETLLEGSTATLKLLSTALQQFGIEHPFVRLETALSHNN